MGGERIADAELQTLGIEIVDTASSGTRMLRVPEQSLLQYVGLVKERLHTKFWNEIVGPEVIRFIFKFADGHTKEYVLSPETESEIDALCAEFNNEPPEKTQNVYKYLSENDFYHDYMHRYYGEMIARGLGEGA